MAKIFMFNGEDKKELNLPKENKEDIIQNINESSDFDEFISNLSCDLIEKYSDSYEGLLDVYEDEIGCVSDTAILMATTGALAAVSTYLATLIAETDIDIDISDASNIERNNELEALITEIMAFGMWFYNTTDSEVIDQLPFAFQGKEPLILEIGDNINEMSTLSAVDNIKENLNDIQRKRIESIGKIIMDHNIDSTIFFLNDKGDIIEETNTVVEGYVDNIIAESPFVYDSEEDKEYEGKFLDLFSISYGLDAKYLFIITNTNDKVVHPILYKIDLDGNLQREDDDIAEKMMIKSIKEYGKYF